MNLDLLNNSLNNSKDNNLISKFIRELSEFLKKENNAKINQLNSLKQENCLYQVVEMGINCVYLENLENCRVFKENDIPKDILEKISNDTVLKYKDGKYVIEEEITQRFFDSLVGIKEYVDIQKKFTQESNILQNSLDTIYKIQERNEKYTIVTYEKNGICTIKVPNELIPYWSKKGEYLKYKNGDFQREIMND